ncbi:putative sulfate exporter family transporter [Thermanaerosceptrum fracticalcis]|uniref:Putative sulfate exporter family transporter n=1 Tax=Thermanaerosceptrum fracticalcis TaxID=1712410 RepID=A0A7G6E3A9_THEFR|nr:YeiH family protein [Thermanaerosceptrum fracticalcis]QNB46563.1 putative sulfate exporter family transporter [Thermanaerosceptrum fracticalcis]
MSRSSILPGLLLTAIIAYVSEYLHSVITFGGQKPVSGVTIAILIGMAIENSVGLASIFKAGVHFSQKKILKIAIILLGLSLSFITVITTGSKALIIILICISFALTITYFLGKKLGLPEKLAVLIGVGTAICGSTAIVASSPAIAAKDEEVSFSVGTITVFGVIAVFLYPILGKLLLLSDMQFGTWAGVAVNDTSQVVAAGFAYSEAAGKIATVVKLTRTVLLAPLVLILGIIYTKKQDIGTKDKVNYIKIFPWFVVGFIAMAVLRTIGDTLFAAQSFWPVLLEQSKELSKFLIVMAMSGVGLLTNFEQMKKVGLKPFITGLIASLIMAVFSLSMIYALGI